MSVTLSKNYYFTLDLGNAVFNFATDQLVLAFTDTAPTTATHTYSNITAPLATTNIVGGASSLYLAGTTGWSQTTGTATLPASTFTITSQTGNFGPFRYVIVYDNTSTNKNIIGWYDNGSEITLNGVNGDQFVMTFASGILTNA
jgi:hypothetical protein